MAVTVSSIAGVLAVRHAPSVVAFDFAAVAFHFTAVALYFTVVALYFTVVALRAVLARARGWGR